MKYILSIFIFCYMGLNSMQAQCTELLKAKDLTIADLNKEVKNKQGQVDQLQTTLTTLIARGGGTSGGGGGVTYEKEYNQAKKDITLLRDQIKEIERERDNKDALLKTANKEIDKLKEEAASAAKIQEAQAQDLKKITQELEDYRKKYAELNKAFQDSTKVVLVLKTDAQILHDSLYMSVDFINKGIVHIDSKPDGKQVKLDDILIEVPYTVINSRDWPNDIQVKLTQIGALYIKYKDKLMIQLTGAPIETEEDKKAISTIFGKLMSRFSIYANAGRPNGDKISLERDKDFQFEFSEKGKQGLIRVALIKRK